MTINEVRKELQAAADPEYREFHRRLVPGLTSMLGARMPKVRAIGKAAAKKDWKTIWEELDENCYEELMLKGLLIGYASANRKEQTEYLRTFIPKINNWAICDCCCSTWKFLKTDPEYWFAFLTSWLSSEREYELRFVLVALLDYFIDELYLEKIFQILDQLHHEGYYVKMAAAWLISVCYVRYPKETKCYLSDNRLDDFTQNKAIQKIRESYRVSKEEKEQLQKYKRIENILQKEHTSL